jgi:cell division initiation protein
MDATPGTPHLLTDVRFSVSRKGYDPDEVDNFLERVSAAVAQLQDKLRQATADAETAKAREQEAVRAQTQLKGRIAELESGGAVQVVAAPVVPIITRSGDEEAEAAASVLVMAQRTADSTVNEARTNSAQMLIEAEQEASRILGVARVQADESLRDLERARNNLAADNAALEAFVNEQRAVLAGGVSRIQAVLDDPSALRVSPAPVEVAPITPVAAVATPVEEAPVPEPVEGLVEELVEEPADVAIVTVDDLDDSAPAKLFPSEENPVDSGPPTAAVSIFDANEDDFLSDSDDDADAAMRRFFDADFEDDERFGR